MEHEQNDAVTNDQEEAVPISQEESTFTKKEKGSFAVDCYTLLHDLVYILAFVTIFFVFALRVVSVSGSSMYPTLVDRDYVTLLSNVFYRDIEPGDIVVARVPTFDEEPIVKRVIATAGQTVDIDFEQGVVYVDGAALEEDYIFEPTHNQFYERGVTFPLTVDQGHVFLLGDNRNDSYDSRLSLIGQVDTRYVLGKVVFLMLPGYDERTQTRTFGRIGVIS